MNPVTLTKTIAGAIAGHRVLRVTYKGESRTVEPYLIYVTKAGDLILHGRQIAGAYVTTPPPDWCNLRVAEIAAAEASSKNFRHPHPDYNPESDRFHKVIFQLPAVATTSH